MDIKDNVVSKGSYYINRFDFLQYIEFNLPWERGQDNRMEIFSSIKLVYEN